MPNLVEALRNRILAQHPGALLIERGERRIKHLIETLPDGRQHFAVDVGPLLHYHDGATWQEINTDWLDSAETGFVDTVQAAGFTTHSDASGRRRLYPRRGVAGEYVEFARLQAWNGTSFVNIPWSSRQRATDAVTFDRANASLSIVHTGAGLKVNVTLKDASAAARLRWPVSLVGLHRVGWQLVSDADGTVVATIRPPVITEDGNGPLETPRPVQCAVVGGAVEFTADLTGLAYPIVIDPTIDANPAAGADDAQEDSLGAVSTSDLSFLIRTTTALWAGFRFPTIGIPTGATIDANTSYISLSFQTTSADDPDMDIYCEANDTGQFTSGAGSYDISGRTRTSAGSKVTWTATALGTGYKNSPYLTGPLQEVIDGASWAQNNAIVVICNALSTSVAQVRTYEQGSGLWPILHIEYTTAGATVVASRRSLLGVGV